MSKQYLEMKYHPAKKEVKFRRFQNNKECEIRNESILMTHMSEKGKFILQDKGNQFFDDIADAFDGEETVEIQVVTTETDYIDFEYMVDYYNRSDDAKCEIQASLHNTLPSMDDMYRDIVYLSTSVLDIINQHKKEINQMDLQDAEVKVAVDTFIEELDAEYNNVYEKLESLQSTNINICLAGVYSSGKSTLINNLLGCKVLPEHIESKTAKMFKIMSPKKGEPVSVVFVVSGEKAKIQWSQGSNAFIFDFGAIETSERKAIQDCINEVKTKDENMQHHQLYQILEVLNAQENVSQTIELYYPIELDNDKLQFTIYDTPGSDSNVDAHKDTLIEALSEQTHSILIFIMTPDKLEGEGNNILLQILDDAEKNKSKTTIDVSRSLFIMNKADSADEDSLRALANKNLENKEKTISIPLRNKKMFFTIANLGRTAKMVGKGMANKKEEKEFHKNKDTYIRYPEDASYQFNHYGLSEISTLRSIERCEKELAMYMENENETKALEVLTGISAIEHEIIMYGEKFAVSVKTYAIMHSVGQVLRTLDNKIKMMEKDTNLKLEQIDNDIRILSESLKRSMGEISEKYTIRNNLLPTEELNSLKLDGGALQSEVMKPIDEYMDSRLQTTFFGKSDKVLMSTFNNEKDNISNKVNTVFTQFDKQFQVNSQRVLREKRQRFFDEIKRDALKNDELSDEGRTFIEQLQTPNFRIQVINSSVNTINDLTQKSATKRMIFPNYTSKKDYMSAVEKDVQSTAVKVFEACKEMYSNSLNDVTTNIEKHMKNNLKNYSSTMKAMIQNKEIMEQFKNEIISMGGEVSEEYGKLNSTIWKEGVE